MNIYRLGDYEDSVWVTHELEMNEAELRGLLLAHLRPLAEAERALEEEGRVKFGKGAKFFHVRDGKVYTWSADNNGEEVTGADPAVFEEWQERYLTARGDGFNNMLAAAGFTKLEPTAGLFCPDRGPLATLEKLEASR